MRVASRWIAAASPKAGRCGGSGGGVIPVDQLAAVADDDAIGDLQDTVMLVVAAPPDAQDRLVRSDLELLLLIWHGEAAGDGGFEAQGEGEQVSAGTPDGERHIPHVA